MNSLNPGARIALKNILFLTDFSEPSEAAVPFALAVAREYGARIHALHVLTLEPRIYPTPAEIAAAAEAQDERANLEMQRLEAQLDGVPHEATVVRGISIWEEVERAVRDCAADMIVLGTHGRTGAAQLLMGSVAEEIFRRSPVPVLTIGPWARAGRHSGARFHRVLFATDFAPESVAAAPYAVSLAREHNARLMLLHVVREPKPEDLTGPVVISEAGITHELRKLAPRDERMCHHPETIIEYGEPAEQILHVAKAREADFIVLGARGPDAHSAVVTHLGRTTAHKVVAHAHCPVLTVRA